MRLTRWLKDNPRQKFAIFAIGSLCLMCGLTAILIAEFRVPPGDFRNHLVLGALGLCVLGGVTALVGYIGLSFGRIARFFEEGDDVEKDSEPDR